MKNKKQILTNKRGVSLVIGYILLISIAIVMSIFVYQWLKTYVPKETPKCYDGTSIFIKELYYDCTSGDEELGILVKNNGKFSIHGFFIHASDDESKEALAIIDFSPRMVAGGSASGNAIVFDGLADNNLIPGKEQAILFNVTDYCPCGIEGRTLTKIELIPTRIQEIDGKKRFISCSDAKVEEPLTCLT